MGTWGLLGGILSFAIGVVQLASGDWRGALWSVLGVGLMYVRARWR
ncbi:hypothetical protein [Deinococcus alpinitundrae]|nr:hypothetical protein [Deinococcus alpinitundrae]